MTKAAGRFGANGEDFLEIARRAAAAGGEVLRDWAGKVQPVEKGPNDWVTEADTSSQAAIVEVLRRECPDHGIWGEEESAVPEAGQLEGLCWLVDPLDGTTNFVHQLPSYCVSIALCENRRPLVSVVLDPRLGETYEAVRGGGATLNGRPMGAGSCRRLGSALVAASLPARVQPGSVEVERMLDVLYRARGLRRLGSCALNLCYIAAGRLDAYWATSVQPWDVAAGWLIVEEAGGVVRGWNGGPPEVTDPRFVAAGTVELCSELARVVSSRPAGSRGTTDRSGGS